MSFVEKHNRYSNWEARVAVSEKAVVAPEARLQSARVAQRRRLKTLRARCPFVRSCASLCLYLATRFLDGAKVITSPAARVL
jgi:hypothetical protein